MKRILALIVSCALALGAAPALAGTAGRTVTDVWGREIVIPDQVMRIACLGSGAPRIAAYLGVMDMLVGAEDYDIASMTVLRDYSPVYQEQLAALPSVGAGGGSGSNNGYAEQLILAAPDVILAGFSAEAADELQRQTDIPVVAVRYISKGLANDTFYAAVRVFAQTVGALERGERLLAYIDACKEDLSARTRDVPDADKLTAYAGAVTFSGQHGFAGTYSQFGPFDAIHAVNVADMPEVDGYYEADLEKIVVWDPDVIFLDPGNMGLVNDEYAKNPDYFDSLRAVREQRVYTMPSFNHAGTNISYALINAYHAGKVLFPEQFADVDLEETAARILVEFLGRNTLDEMAAGGLTYGSIQLGK